MIRRRVALTAAAAAAALVTGSSGLLGAAVAAPAKAGPPTCFGKKATIVNNAKNATVKGTNKGDVIVALGKGAKVTGGAGNDLICTLDARSVDAGDGNDKVAFRAGTIKGGRGNDTLLQKGAGRALVLGQDGNDVITLDKGDSTADGGNGNDRLTSGSAGRQRLLGGRGIDSLTSRGATLILDGGPDPDMLTVPAGALTRTLVVAGAGDLLNGVPVRVDAPTTPDAFLTLDGDTPDAGGRVVGTTTTVLLQGSHLQINRALAPTGRTLTGWSVNFGDGSPVLAGAGLPPSDVPHDFLTNGTHVITVTVTDSAGVTSVRTLAADTAKPSSLSLASAQAGPTATFSPTYTAGAGSAPVTYVYDFGDGTPPLTGAGAPGPVSHTYAPGSYTTQLSVLDDHGRLDRASQGVVVDDGNPHLNLVTSSDYPLISAGRQRSGVTLPTSTVTVGQGLRIDISSSINVFPGTGSTIDLGDGRGPLPFSSVISDFRDYGVPGVKIITVVLRAPGQPDTTATKTINVLPQAIRAEVSAPAAAAEGVVPISTAGTVSAGSTLWSLSVGDRAPLTGFGGVPAALPTALAPGSYGVSLQLVDPNGASTGAFTRITVTGVHDRVSSFGAFASRGFGSASEGWVPVQAGVDSVGFFADAIPSTGHRLVGGTLNYGDGAVILDPAGIHSGSLDRTTAHIYGAPGTYTAVLTVVDDAGQQASQRLTVSAVGAPAFALTAPSGGTAGAPTTVSTSGSAPGSGAGSLEFSVSYGDGTPDTTAYGALPSALTHTYADPGTYRVTVTVLNDHQVTTTREVDVTVS